MTDLEAHADHARARMRADHRSDEPRDALIAREHGIEQVEQLVHVRCLDVQHRACVDRLRLHAVGERGQRLRASPDLGRFLDHSVAYLDDGLDRQHRAEQRAGIADPAAALEELERVERAEESGAVPP